MSGTAASSSAVGGGDKDGKLKRLGLAERLDRAADLREVSDTSTIGIPSTLS